MRIVLAMILGISAGAMPLRAQADYAPLRIGARWEFIHTVTGRIGQPPSHIFSQNRLTLTVTKAVRDGGSIRFVLTKVADQFVGVSDPANVIDTAVILESPDGSLHAVRADSMLARMFLGHSLPCGKPVILSTGGGPVPALQCGDSTATPSSASGWRGDYIEGEGLYDYLAWRESGTDTPSPATYSDRYTRTAYLPGAGVSLATGKAGAKAKAAVRGLFPWRVLGRDLAGRSQPPPRNLTISTESPSLR